LLTGQAARGLRSASNQTSSTCWRELAADVVGRSGDDSIGEANWSSPKDHRAAHSLG